MKTFLTAETRLSHADLEHMSLTRRSPMPSQRIAPPWAFSRDAIRAVVLAKLKRYTRFSGGCKSDEIQKANDLAALDKLARKTQRALRRFDKPKYRTYHVRAHLDSLKSRSLAALWIYEIYCAYRLGRRSTDIAETLGITPWSVRQHLRRLNVVAREVCPRLCAPAREYGGPHSRENYLGAKIAEVEQQVERATKSKKYRPRVPFYQARLDALRKLKETRDAERKAATVFRSRAA